MYIYSKYWLLVFLIANNRMWVIHKFYTPSCCDLGMWRHQEKEVQQGKKQVGQTFRQVLNKCLK